MKNGQRLTDKLVRELPAPATGARIAYDADLAGFGAGEFTEDQLLRWSRTWLDTKFEGGRHQRRVSKFESLD